MDSLAFVWVGRGCSGVSEDLGLQGMFLGLYSCERSLIRMLQDQMEFGAHCLTYVGDPSLKRSSVPPTVGAGYFREGTKYLMLCFLRLDHNGIPQTCTCFSRHRCPHMSIWKALAWPGACIGWLCITTL